MTSLHEAKGLVEDLARDHHNRERHERSRHVHEEDCQCATARAYRFLRDMVVRETGGGK